MKYVYKNERVTNQYEKVEDWSDWFAAITIAVAGIYFLIHILVFTFK